MSVKRRRMMSDINVVPYIDVMLVLLIIFMITAPLITQGVKIDIPQAPSEVFTAVSQEPVIVSLALDGRLYVDFGDSPEQPVQTDILVNRVAAILKYKPIRIPAAVPKLIGITKVNQFRLKATLFAATSLTLMAATKKEITENIAISRNTDKPIGWPTRNSRLIVSDFGFLDVEKKAVSLKKGRLITMSINASWTHHTMAVARPQPTPPSSGNPKCP